MDYDEEITHNTKRHKIGIDVYSIIENDSEIIDKTEDFLSSPMYITIISSLDTDREKFIALALDNGFQQNEIATMLKVDPSRITRNIQVMRLKLAEFKK